MQRTPMFNTSASPASPAPAGSKQQNAGDLFSMMRDVMQSTKQATGRASASSAAPLPAAQASNATKASGQQKGKLSQLFGALDSSDEDDDFAQDEFLKQGVREGDVDLKTVDMLTKKIAQDLGAGFLDISDDEDEDDLGDDIDDAEFRAQLMQEFKNLQSPALALGQGAAGEGSTIVPKQRVKQLYLDLLRQGSSIMKDKGIADSFMGKLNAMELAALMSVLQMDPDQTIRYFGNDPEVIEAIQSTPAVAPSASEALWRDLTADDLVDDEEDGDGNLEGGKSASYKLRAKASPAVQEALRVFESNLVFYSQQPQQLLALCDKLPTEKDQQLFLDVLFQEYTPEKMEQRIKAERYVKEQEAKKKQSQLGKFDSELVANVFKEVFTHFRAYKKHPEKFEPLTSRLGDADSLETKAFESLVRAFWDLDITKVKL